MSETLWYYRSNLQRIAEILRKRLIFQRDGKIASFTSNTLGWCFIQTRIPARDSDWQCRSPWAAFLFLLRIHHDLFQSVIDFNSCMISLSLCSRLA
jgi:hypothetical protein